VAPSEEASKQTHGALLFLARWRAERVALPQLLCWLAGVDGSQPSADSVAGVKPSPLFPTPVRIVFAALQTCAWP